MENLNGHIESDSNQLGQIEAENLLLREENQQLRARLAAGQEKLKQQQILEQKYEESQSRFQAIFNQSKLGNKVIGPDLKILQINPAFLRLLGYTEQDMVGTKITEYAHPDFVHHWNELQQSLWTKQIPSFQIETCLLKKDGSVLWCQVTSITFRDQGTTLGYTILEDINQRKQLELALEKLYDNQETIMHMIVHDLKSYLLNIKFLNEMLLDNLLNEAAPGAEKKDNLTLIQQSSANSDKAFALVGDILLIGRLDAPDEEPFEETNLNNYISEQLKNMGLDAVKKKIRINFQPPSEAVYARIIPTKFTHVLKNLLSNAVKFTQAGGQITISLANNGKKALLQVSDTGIGIPEHLQSSIFQKFTKANRVGTEGESTTGLGLYIVKQIVEKHKGTIRVVSQENQGTSFFIQLN